MAGSFPKTRAFRWTKGRLELLDQRLLPFKTAWVVCRTWQDVARGIQTMVVRGAPAIGCVAAYGVVLAARAQRFKSLAQQRSFLEAAAKGLLEARPTAVNLRWALERMLSSSRQFVSRDPSSIEDKENGPRLTIRRSDDMARVADSLEKDARAIEEEDRSANLRMGQFGAEVIPRDAILMTICNTGSLATAGLGTAFGVIWTAAQQKKVRRVYACETRPYLQGARLTAWELKQEKIPFELITDNMAAHIMKTEKIDAVLAGADRIAANGDTANKIGTYNLAVLAAYHRVPFYIAAPLSTVDLRCDSGAQIPIEERSSEEVTSLRGLPIAPRGTKARHPAFDVTPAELITGIFTPRGVARPPYRSALATLAA